MRVGPHHSLRTAGLVALLSATAACERFCPDDPTVAIGLPTDQVDTFDQKLASRVDILWMVDNSGSMLSEQKKIASRFNDFFSELITSQVDYHIGVINSDPVSGGQLAQYQGPAVDGCTGCRFLTTATPCPNPDVVTEGLSDPEIETTLAAECPSQLVFRKLVQTGADGTPFEQGFQQAATALGAQTLTVTGFPDGAIPGNNADFLRTDASLYIIFVSDEDEGAKQDGSPVRYYQRLFEGLKAAGNENKVSVSAITGWPLDSDTPPIADVCRILETTFDGNPANDDPQATKVKEIIASGETGCIDQAAGANDDSAFAETGGRYIELACRTGGVVSNMCDADYSTALDQLGANAAGLLRKFVLSRPQEMEAGPDCLPYTTDDSAILYVDCDGNGNTNDDIDGPICVKARPVGSAEGSEALIPRATDTGAPLWSYEQGTSSVRFDGSFIPAPGSIVEIRYNLTTRSECKGAQP